MNENWYSRETVIEKENGSMLLKCKIEFYCISVGKYGKYKGFEENDEITLAWTLFFEVFLEDHTMSVWLNKRSTNNHSVFFNPDIVALTRLRMESELGKLCKKENASFVKMTWQKTNIKLMYFKKM